MTLTFAPLEQNRGRELKHTKTKWFLSTLVPGRAMIARQPQMLQMSAVETGQMSSVLSQHHIVCVSETGQGSDTSIATDLDNRTGTFQTDRTPQDRIAVRF